MVNINKLFIEIHIVTCTVDISNETISDLGINHLCYQRPLYLPKTITFRHFHRSQLIFGGLSSVSRLETSTKFEFGYLTSRYRNVTQPPPCWKLRRNKSSVQEHYKGYCRLSVGLYC